LKKEDEIEVLFSKSASRKKMRMSFSSQNKLEEGR
jgi:hypothetical protein